MKLKGFPNYLII